MDPPPPAAAAAASPILQKLISFDTSFSLHLHTLAQPYIPRAFLLLLEISGDGRFFFPVVLSLLYPPHLRHFFLPLLLAALLDLIVIGLTKHLIQRPRPVYNKNMSLTVSVDHWSFPSGHSSRVFMISTFSFLCWDEIYQMLLKFASFESGNFANLVWVLWGWALATSVSRILLGRHFVFDVIVGASVGVLEGLFAFRFLKLSQFAVSVQGFLLN